MKKCYEWEPERLQRLIDVSGCSCDQIACQSGISSAALHQYLSGNQCPGLKALLGLADLFAVPLDYLVGRCDEEEAKLINKSYPDCYMKLRRKEFEELLLRNCYNRDKIVKKGYEAPYPYNLLEDVFQEPVNHILTEDEHAGLQEALKMLTDKERAIILVYYGSGVSLKEAGKEFNLTSERIRQILTKAIRKLRYPTYLNSIRYGIEGLKRISDLSTYALELSKKEAELEKRELSVTERERALSYRESLTSAQSKDEPQEEDPSDYDRIREEVFTCGWRKGQTYKIPSRAFEDLHFTVRTYNCLTRADIMTVSDIMDKMRDGGEELIKIRNLGRRSLEEIEEKVSKMTGIDIYELTA